VPIVLPRHAEIWLPDYLRSLARARRERSLRHGIVDIMFAVADHYEPLHGQASFETGLRRVERWVAQYPEMASQFTDADGRHPQHTFFFPIEQYRPEFLEPLADLCRRGFGEVEVHLHHDNDTAENLREQLSGFVRTLHERHSLLSRDGSGRIRYGFVHGNWALDNSLPDRRWCGVDGELAVLRDTGCYADFTLPAAPSPAQTRTVNQVYYARTDLRGPKAPDRGRRATVGRVPSREDLLMVQGPLAVTWKRPRWGIVPRLESGALDAGNPPTAARFADWLSCGICVAGRPDWVFIKVHTHGAPERNADMLLGPQTAAFHRDLLPACNDGKRFRLHYVTAREMVNIIHAAEDGETGHPADYRNYGFAAPAILG
jgi:hypothetical protein